MTKDRISISQLSLLYLLLIAGGKFLKLPSILAQDVGHDSWLTIAFSFLWDAVCLVFLLWAIKINRESKLDISAVLNNTITKVGAKIVLAIFFVIFIVRTNILLASCYKMFAVTFDVSTNWVVFVLPIVALSVLALKLGFNSIARASQLLFGVIFLCVVVLVIPPVTRADMGSLLPVGEAGWGKILSTSVMRSFWFTDYVFVYLVFDNVKIKKRVFSPVMTAFVIGAVLTVLMNAIFVSLYGSLAGSFDLAMSKIGIHFVSSSANGRWDWLTLSIWLISVFFKIVVFFFCAYKCAEKIFEFNSDKINVWAVIVITLLLMLPIFLPTEIALTTVVQYGLIPFAVVQYALPIAMPFLTKAAQVKLGKAESLQTGGDVKSKLNKIKENAGV